MVTVIADQRERSSGVIKELVKNGIHVEVKQLLAADYVVQTRDINGKILNIGIERKVLNDFLNSIIDKRILNQLIEIKNHFSMPLLILEGADNIYSIRNFHPNSIRGMLATIAVDFQVPIISTKNHRDTAAFITILANRLEKPRSPISLLQKRKPLTLREQQEYIIQSLPNIGPSIAKELLKKFKTVEKIFSASKDNLMKVDKIGKKRAEEIKKIIETTYKTD